jgi:HlyD family secretion protein
MKRVVWGIVIAGLVAAGWWGYAQWQTAQQAAVDEAAAAEAAATEDVDNVIWASGKLLPRRWAGLSPAYTGLVTALHVQEGQWVQPDDLLVELDVGLLAAQVESAQAAVAEAEASLAQLRAGATTAEIAAAQAALAAAQAQVSLAAGQMLEVEAAITQAEAQVQIARGQYAELASHPTAAEITAADARVAVAQTAVEHAQAAYNLVRGDPQIASRPESLALYQATAAHAAALAEAALIKAGPTPEQLAVVNDQILAAEAAREMTRARAPGSEAATQAALADLARAQAALDGLVAGATTEEIAMAEARAQQARAAQRMAEAQLAQAQVRAPFAGQIGSISTRVGELATPGTSLLLLGDPTVLFVETTDLRETDVVRLRLGMAVEVSFDALPDRLFQGTISEIAPVSNTDRGSTNYTVRIDVTDLDPALRWGMTAFVNILAPR